MPYAGHEESSRLEMVMANGRRRVCSPDSRSIFSDALGNPRRTLYPRKKKRENEKKKSSPFIPVPTEYEI